MNASPRCSLAGVVTSGGTTGICLRSDHPCCRIPALQDSAPAVPTERGWLRPERSLVYNNQDLLLHEAAAAMPGQLISAAQLAGFEKTARRLLSITAPYPWARPEALEWLSPEALLFTTTDDQQLHQLCSLDDSLVQAETLELGHVDGRSFLRFKRC